jgi:hypothetical protein
LGTAVAGHPGGTLEHKVQVPELTNAVLVAQRWESAYAARFSAYDPHRSSPGLSFASRETLMSASTTRTSLRSTAGQFTFIRVDDRAVVWLRGDIDYSTSSAVTALSPGLDGVRELTVDVWDVHFCDGTFATFVAGLVGHTCVTVRHPNRLLRDYLRVVGLANAVQIQNGWYE